MRKVVDTVTNDVAYVIRKRIYTPIKKGNGYMYIEIHNADPVEVAMDILDTAGCVKKWLYDNDVKHVVSGPSIIDSLPQRDIVEVIEM